VLLAVVYVRANPLVFNESLWQHAHCIKCAGMELDRYAEQNGGKFPSHPNGYGDALLLLDENCYYTLTGPGYDAAPFHEAKKQGRHLSEEECGRVYIQGLTRKSNPEIALLFDKLPTPGGDHCHFPARLTARLGREVWFVGGNSTFVEESAWPAFASRQVELLAASGFPREEAERLFASKARQ
jgi:hypothetical protein